jgi:hypothetical protein
MAQKKVFAFSVFLLLSAWACAGVRVDVSGLNACLPESWEIAEVESGALPLHYEHVKAELPRGLHISLRGPRVPDDAPNTKARGSVACIDLWFMPLSLDVPAAQRELKNLGAMTPPAAYIGKTDQFKVFVKAFFFDDRLWATYLTDLKNAFSLQAPD